jgi:dTMP kinase
VATAAGKGFGQAQRLVLIVVEGVSGAGKSTLVNRLTVRLRAAGQTVVDLAEREATTIDPAWRLGDLMRTATTPLDPTEAALLYATRTMGRDRLARTQLVAHPSSVVMADRFDWSLAAQLRLAGLAEDVQRVLLALVTQALTPRLAILLEIDFAEHVQRLRQRHHHPLNETEFHALQHAFRQDYDRCPWPRLQIDSTSLTPAEVEARAFQEINLLGNGLENS